MSSKKLAKSYLNVSIKEFCHPNPSAEAINLKCDISVDTVHKPNQFIGSIPLSDQQKHVTVPIISENKYLRISLYDSNTLIDASVYRVNDFLSYKGSYLGQWVNFQSKKEPTNVKQSNNENPQTIKVFLEFIVDTEENIKKFRSWYKGQEIPTEIKPITKDISPNRQQAAAYSNNDGGKSLSRNNSKERAPLSERFLGDQEKKKVQSHENNVPAKENKPKSKPLPQSQEKIKNYGLQNQNNPNCAEAVSHLRKQNTPSSTSTKKLTTNKSSQESSKATNSIPDKGASANLPGEHVKASLEGISPSPVGSCLGSNSQLAEISTKSLPMSDILQLLQQNLQSSPERDAILDYFTQINEFSDEFKQAKAENETLKAKLATLQSLSNSKAKNKPIQETLKETEDKTQKIIRKQPTTMRRFNEKKF